jgi:hypothetical protein
MFAPDYGFVCRFFFHALADGKRLCLFYVRFKIRTVLTVFFDFKRNHDCLSSHGSSSRRLQNGHTGDLRLVK